MDTKSIEVIIRAFNEEDWLISCIKSIENQSIYPEKVKIVDNNSSDSTASRSKYLISHSPLNIEYCLYTNLPEGYRPGHCLNQYALMSTSKFIVFICSFIPVDKYWLENMYEAINYDNNVAGDMVASCQNKAIHVMRVICCGLLAMMKESIVMIPFFIMQTVLFVSRHYRKYLSAKILLILKIEYGHQIF